MNRPVTCGRGRPDGRRSRERGEGSRRQVPTRRFSSPLPTATLEALQATPPGAAPEGAGAGEGRGGGGGWRGGEPGRPAPTRGAPAARARDRTRSNGMARLVSRVFLRPSAVTAKTAARNAGSGSGSGSGGWMDGWIPPPPSPCRFCPAPPRRWRSPSPLRPRRGEAPAPEGDEEPVGSSSSLPSKSRETARASREAAWVRAPPRPAPSRPAAPPWRWMAAPPPPRPAPPRARRAAAGVRLGRRSALAAGGRCQVP